MGFIDLHKPLMDLIPNDYKLWLNASDTQSFDGRETFKKTEFLS